MRVAVVTLAAGRHDHLAAQHRSLVAGGRRPDLYLVVAMGDPGIVEGEVDGLLRRVEHLPVGAGGRLPLAAARNAAADAGLRDGADVLVFLDVDCLAGPGLVQAYVDVVRDRPGTVWSGPVTYLPPPEAGGYDVGRLEALDDPHPARPAPAPGEVLVGADPDLFWSLSFALSADSWRRSGGFCEAYTGYGGEDTDFGRACRARGLDLGWVGSARAYHQHHPVDDPPVAHVDDILRNGAIFHDRWGEWPMRGWLEAFEQRGLVRRAGEGWVRSPSAGGSPAHGARPVS